MLKTTDGINERGPNAPRVLNSKPPSDAASLHDGREMRGQLESRRLSIRVGWEADSKAYVGSKGPRVAKTVLGKKKVVEDSLYLKRASCLTCRHGKTVEPRQRSSAEHRWEEQGTLEEARGL